MENNKIRGVRILKTLNGVTRNEARMIMLVIHAMSVAMVTVV